MPDAYQLQLERRAERALQRIPESDHRRLERAIDALAEDPRPSGALKLRSRDPTYRVRIGEYRVIYAVFDVERLVKILDVSRRTGQTYRRLDR